MTLRVRALTTGADVSSARFRVRQYIPALAEAGIEVKESTSPFPLWLDSAPGWFGRGRARRAAYRAGFMARAVAARIPAVVAARHADVTWVQKEFLPGFVTLEGLCRNLVFDVDDGIWTAGPWAARSARAIARAARIVVAGNEEIARWFSDANQRVEVVPTAVDTHAFRPWDGHRETERLVIGWIGSRSAIPALEGVESALAAFLARTPRAELRVVSSHRPRFFAIPPNRWQFIPWTAERGPEEVRRMDIGLMPLPLDEQSRYKCSLKMLQSMAAGLPVVVSPVGMNARILDQHRCGLGPKTDAEWVEALSALSDSAELRAELGARGRRAVLNEYALERQAEHLAEILKAAAQPLDQGSARG